MDDELRLDREKWEQERIWRDRELDIRLTELSHSRFDRRLAVASMCVSVAAICGSVWASVHLAATSEKAARQSAEIAATSARVSAEKSSVSAQDSAERSAAAMNASAERNASAMRESSERGAKAAIDALEMKWQLDLQEDQRKAIAVLASEFSSSLLPAFDLAHETIENALRRELRVEEVDAYDHLQRKNLISVQIASGRLYLESRDAAFAFAPAYERFKQIDDDIMFVGRSAGYSRAAKLNGWCRLQKRLRRINLAPALDSLRASQVRPGISPPKLDFRAPPRLPSDSMLFEPDPEEEKCTVPAK